ncbi:MAG: LysM peptidoglycan-binding domain-containing protein [Oligosphaeraceae bacterium]|nr:LysM peptidoglycan-binding domain-containing protein [Oligosphaeraceae bacterium]
MKKIFPLQILLLFVGAALPVLTSCANLGATEPVLSGGSFRSPASSNQIAPREPLPAQSSVAAPKFDDSQLNQELAKLRADLRILQEDNQKLQFRVENLEKDNLAKDAQMKELQSLLSVLDGQVAAADKTWSTRMETLKQTMDAERSQRQKQLEALSSNVATELSKVRQPPPAAPAASGQFKEIVIMRGDTLSSIASSAGISVRALMQYNGLKSDHIREGQTLKVPVQ